MCDDNEMAEGPAGYGDVQKGSTPYYAGKAKKPKKAKKAKTPKVGEHGPAHIWGHNKTK